MKRTAKILLGFILGASLAAWASPAFAVDFIMSGGKLVGANGVSVGGKTYNVTFVEGTCSSVFNGCSDFDFTNSTDAAAAAAALLSDVFVDGPDGNFDSDPSLVFGCDTASVCSTFIPYGIIFDGQAIAAAYANNAGANTPFTDSSAGDGNVRIDENTGTDPYGNWARFTAVPEPATWAMMLLGFGAMGLAFRRKRRLQPA